MLWDAVLIRFIDGSTSQSPTANDAFAFVKFRSVFCGVLDSLGTSIQWIESYVTDDKIYCIYRAKNEDLIQQHAGQGGFPANSIAEIRATIEPTTSE